MIKHVDISVTDVDIAMKKAMEDPNKSNAMFIYADKNGVGAIAANMKNPKLHALILKILDLLENANLEP